MAAPGRGTVTSRNKGCRSGTVFGRLVTKEAWFVVGDENPVLFSRTSPVISGLRRLNSGYGMPKPSLVLIRW